MARSDLKSPSGRAATVRVLTQEDVRHYFDQRQDEPLTAEVPEVAPVSEDDAKPQEAPEGAKVHEDVKEPTDLMTQAYAPLRDGSAEVAAIARDLYRILREYEIPVDEVDLSLAQVGPTVIRFRVRLRPGARIKDLQRRAEDLQRELAAPRVPLIDNVPGEPFIYIDLRRPDRQTVLLRSALRDLPAASPPDLNVPVGVSPAGQLATLDLSDAPHLLVGGATKSGKTMFLYSVIVALACRNTSADLQMSLIDPKETDFVYFEGLPHLNGSPVITDPIAAVEEMKRLIDEELPARTAQLKAARRRDIQDFNERNPAQKMRPLVVIIDEYADLIMVLAGKSKSEFETGINRLAQRGRSVGIHLVIATQRPSIEFVTGALKANMPTRISFRLPSQTDSRVILDRNGAEALFGQGDMLLLEHGEIRRLQGCFVSAEDLDVVLRDCG